MWVLCHVIRQHRQHRQTTPGTSPAIVPADAETGLGFCSSAPECDRGSDRAIETITHYRRRAYLGYLRVCKQIFGYHQCPSRSATVILQSREHDYQSETGPRGCVSLGRASCLVPVQEIRIVEFLRRIGDLSVRWHSAQDPSPRYACLSQPLKYLRSHLRPVKLL
jgi:hypothetical protein